MEKNAYIIYERVYDAQGIQLKIGGIETYLIYLSKVLIERGITPRIVQYADNDFIRKDHGVLFCGYNVGRRNLYKNLYKKIERNLNETDIVIWGLDRCAVKVRHKKTIALQHGIPFDYYQEEKKIHHLIRQLGFGHFLKSFQRFKAISAFRRSNIKVCVDYNFWNWYRTFCLPEEEKHIFIIPNFAEFDYKEQIHKQSEIVNILFARRFVRMRGIEDFISIAAHYKNDKRVNFTFAGEGPYENQIKDLMKSCSNVFLDRYNPEESIKYHTSFDISIIPSIASEGTSLSLLEAMSAGNVVICTFVGGMTNIVIDGLNGFLVRPNSPQEIINLIEKLLNDPSLRKSISINARLTVEKSFSYEKWKERWNRLFDYVYTM